LIVLDGLHIAETGSYLYREDDLPRYFSTLFPTRIDEVVTWNGALCQYSSKLGYGCTLCGEACQHSAITFDGSGVEIDPICCEECGECVAVCPTGALQYERCNDENFARYLDLLPNFSNTTVVIGTDEALHRLWWRAQNQHFAATFFMEFPNPRALSLFHFLNLAMHGAKNVLVLSDNAAESGSEQMMLANIFMDKLLDLKEFVSQMPPETVAANGLSNRLGPAPATADKLTFINRRLTVATALKKLVRQSKRQVSLKAKGDLPFATIHCDENRCTQCGACLNECKIGALSADMTQLSLHHNASLCVACGVCAQTCPEHALSISTSFTLGKEFFSPVQLSQAEPMTCRRCGKVFGTKKSYERVMAILASRETVDASHFAYCETCRVLNIFEEQ
jgi:ferredoxin